MRDDFLHKSLLEGCFHGLGAAILEFPCSENQSPVIWFSVRTEGPGHSRLAPGTGCDPEPRPSPRRGPLNMFTQWPLGPEPQDTLHRDTAPPPQKVPDKSPWEDPLPAPTPTY